jgi:hypothetical protein
MTSAAEKYGKLPQALSGEARQRAIEAGKVLHENKVVQSEGLGTPTRPDATPPVQTQSDDGHKQRGMTR